MRPERTLPPRQRQTRRKAGTQSHGPVAIPPGFRRVARLPNGWTASIDTVGPEALFRARTGPCFGNVVIPEERTGPMLHFNRPFHPAVRSSDLSLPTPTLA